MQKDHEGGPGLPVKYEPGLQEGGPHDVYACFDKLDIVWARAHRVRSESHNEHNRLRPWLFEYFDLFGLFK